MMLLICAMHISFRICEDQPSLLPETYHPIQVPAIMGGYNFPMDPWFIFACFSALFAGIQSSIQKISIHRGVSTVLVNSYGALISGTIAFGIFLFRGAIGHGSLTGYALVFIAGGLYMYGTIARSRSLRSLDTAVVFPTYKSLTLLSTVMGGILLFNDQLSLLKWLGIIISISVPYLLIEIHERHKRRKRSLKEHVHHAGWFLLYVSIFAGAISALLTKFTVPFFDSMLLFTAVNHFFGGTTGLAQQVYTHRGNWKKQFLDTRHPHSHLFLLSTVGGASQCASFFFLLTALTLGQVSTVFAINSAYLVFPVLFSLWYYHEHLSIKRILAIFFSVVAVVLLK